MSNKIPNSELNSSIINIDSIHNNNKKIITQIKQNEKINFFKKRKRSYKKTISLKCTNCNLGIKTDKIKFKSKKDLIDKIKLKFDKFKNYGETLNYNIKLIYKISEKFKKSKVICGKCFEEIIIKDDCVNKIKELFFYNKRKKTKNKNSNFINKSNSETAKRKTGNNEKGFINNKARISIIDVYNDEYEQCLQNIVQYLKLAILEVSCFAQSFKLYIDNRSNFINISCKDLIIEYFFHSYIQTKIKLENIYVLINRIIIKFQIITNKIICSINKNNSYNDNEELKKNFDTFIQNTNVILSNILNFVNNYKILLSFLKCVNKENNIK